MQIKKKNLNPAIYKTVNTIPSYKQKKKAQIISINAEESFDKIQCLFIIKTLRKPGIERELPQFTKGHLKKKTHK